MNRYQKPESSLLRSTFTELSDRHICRRHLISLKKTPIETGASIPKFREERYRQIANYSNHLSLHENGHNDPITSHITAHDQQRLRLRDKLDEMAAKRHLPPRLLEPYSNRLEPRCEIPLRTSDS